MHLPVIILLLIITLAGCEPAQKQATETSPEIAAQGNIGGACETPINCG